MFVASLDETSNTSDENDDQRIVSSSEPELRSSSLLCSSVVKGDLPTHVHKWTKRHIEKYLNMYYESEYLDSPVDILEKIQTIKPLDTEQTAFIDNVKAYLHFDASYKQYDETYNFYTIEGGLKETLEEVILILHKQPARDELLKFKVSRFLKCLHNYMRDIEALRSQHQVYEGICTQLIGSFAEMCCIEAVQCSTENQSIWNNLRGTKVIVSKPDLRFYKSGIQDSKHFGDAEMVVAVMSGVNNAVKQSSQRSEKRLESFSSQLSSISEHSEKVDKPQIEIDLNTNVLGQHAGELLLDLDRFRVKKTMFADEDYVMTMPGMIVSGTQVFFTMLEMKRSHHRKLKYNDKLDRGKDKAKIYYARPLDILVEKERCILIESLMKLNNI